MRACVRRGTCRAVCVILTGHRHFISAVYEPGRLYSVAFASGVCSGAGLWPLLGNPAGEVGRALRSLQDGNA